jgi:CDP-6-deoxy-D-xylo-4-hexulose-3-dehydrase
VVGKTYTTLCNSGSSASLLAMSALTEKYSGKYVVTTALGFPTTVTPIYQCNKIPIYIDIDPLTFSPDLKQFRLSMFKYRDDLCGVVFAHTLGFPFEELMYYDTIGKSQFFMVDNADALGAGINTTGYDLLQAPDVVTLSFFPAHQITTAEGGAILTDDKELHKIIDSYASWGKDCYCLPGQDGVCGKRFEQSFDKMPEGYDHKYTFTRLGYNMKMTEFQAALGLSQLSRLDDFVTHRVAVCKTYELMFREIGVDKYFDFVNVPTWSFPSPFGFPLIRKDDAPFTTQEVINYLEDNKIGTRRMFGGNLIRQPAFEGLPYIKLDLSGSDKLMNDCLWLGCWPGITDQMMEYVVCKLEDFIKEK